MGSVFSEKFGRNIFSKDYVDEVLHLGPLPDNIKNAPAEPYEDEDGEA